MVRLPTLQIEKVPKTGAAAMIKVCCRAESV